MRALAHARAPLASRGALDHGADTRVVTPGLCTQDDRGFASPSGGFTSPPAAGGGRLAYSAGGFASPPPANAPSVAPHELEAQLQMRKAEEKERLMAELAALAALKTKSAAKVEKFKIKLASPPAGMAPAGGLSRGAGFDSGGRASKRERKPTARGSDMISGDSDYYVHDGGMYSEPRAKQPRANLGALRGGVVTPPPTFGHSQPPASKKRPAAVALPPPKGPREAKRRRVEADRAKRMGAMFKKCSSLLKTCGKQQWAWFFAQPVDPVALNLPDYFSIIKQPMDFSTIDQKLARGEYIWPKEFQADMELVFNNCTLYNPAGVPVHSAALAGAQFFEQLWKDSGLEYTEHNEVIVRHGEDTAIAALPEEGPIPAELVPGAAKPRDREAEKARKAAQREAERANATVPSGGRGQRPKKAKRTNSDDTDMSSLDGSEDDESDEEDIKPAKRERPAPPPKKVAAPARPARNTVAAPKPISAPPPPPPRPAMKFEQKRQLSLALQNLPVQKQARVVQIISESQLTQTNEDEIEIDLDQMDNTTLWRLFDFVFPRSKQIDMGIHEIYASEPVVQAPTAAAAAAAAKPQANGGGAETSDSDSSDSDDDRPAATAPPAAAAQAKSEGGDSAGGGAGNTAAPAPGAGVSAAVPQAPVGGAAVPGAAEASFMDVSATGAGTAPAVLKDGIPGRSNGAIGGVAGAPGGGATTLQNASSWANFVANGAGGAAITAAPPQPPADGAGDAAAALWSEFQAKEAENARAEEMRKAAAEAARHEKERAEAAERAARQAELDAAAAQEEAAKQAAAKAEADKLAAREAAKERARAELLMVDQTVNLDAARSIMDEMME